MYDNSRVIDIISKVGKLLRVNGDVGELQALSFDLLAVRVDWGQMLTEKKSQYLHPKDKDLTELDRRVLLNASLANIERDYEFLIGCEKLISERLEYAKLQR